MKSDYVNFTNSNLKYLREKKKITQEKVSKDLKIDQSTIGKWESNSRKITLDWAIRLSQYFEVNIGDFISKNMKEENIYSKRKKVGKNDI